MPNENAVFRCRHTSLDVNIGWSVNGSSPNRFPDIIETSVNENNVRVDMLNIPARSEFTDVEVVCIATFFDGSPSQMTDPVKLIIVTRKLVI